MNVYSTLMITNYNELLTNSNNYKYIINITHTLL